MSRLSAIMYAQRLKEREEWKRSKEDKRGEDNEKR